MGKPRIYKEIKKVCSYSLTPTAKQWLIDEAKRLNCDNPSQMLEKLARGEIKSHLTVL